MRIAVLIPTRGKPEALRTTIGAFQHLESGQHDVRYFVRVDKDEEELYLPFFNQPLPKIYFMFADAPLTPVQKTLDILDNVFFKDFDPDVHVLMSDDIFPMTMHWDITIGGVIHRGIGAFCWEEWGDPANQTYIVLDRHYVDRMPVYLPTWFPFWFSDSWRNEVHMMVFKRAIPIISNLKLGGKRGKTYSMRDLDFWFDFFAHTREDRICEAAEMTKRHGIDFNPRSIPMNHFLLWDEGQRLQIHRYHESMAGAQSPQYEAAKMRAEKHLKTLLDTSSKIMVNG